MRTQAGFTLIEVIVVLGIIGVLASITYISYDSSRDDAANKAIQAELKQVQAALELYKSANGVYPDAATIPGCPIIDGPGYDVSLYASTESFYSDCSGNNGFIDGLIPDYIVDLVDPEKSRNDGCFIGYHIADDQSWYKLTAFLCFAGADEYTEGVQLNEELALCPSSCATCRGLAGAYEEQALFYNSMAIYGGAGAEVCI